MDGKDVWIVCNSQEEMTAAGIVKERRKHSCFQMMSKLCTSKKHYYLYFLT